jgi:methionyl-tRNA formyltransferase
MANPVGNASHDPPAALRLGFAGTPEFAARILRDCWRRAGPVVYTQPDRPGGRGRQLQAVTGEATGSGARA